MIYITIIGSRETPKIVCDNLTEIGKWCRDNGVIVRSGHAEGADWAAEQGAQENCIAYVPWASFNKHLVSKAKIVSYYHDDLTEELAKKYHPIYDSLSDAAKKIMCRNIWQVAGDKLDTPSEVIICYTKDGKIIGGTGQALRAAKDMEIDIINLGQSNHSLEKIVECLKELL